MDRGKRARGEKLNTFYIVTHSTTQDESPLPYNKLSYIGTDTLFSLIRPEVFNLLPDPQARMYYIEKKVRLIQKVFRFRYGVKNYVAARLGNLFKRVKRRRRLNALVELKVDNYT